MESFSLEQIHQDQLRQPEMQLAQYHQLNARAYRCPFVIYDEEFRQVSQYVPQVEDYFWISNYGRVYNSLRGYLINPNYSRDGYESYALQIKPEYRSRYATNAMTIQGQILVALAFIGAKPSPIHQVNHIDCWRTNNYYENLEWVTPAENIEHSRNLGNYHNPDGSYRNSVYKKVDIEKLCEYMQMGITDPQRLSQLVFGMPATPGILALIRDLKSGEKWSFVTRNYNLPEVDHRNFVNDEFITRVCELFQNTPGSIDWPHAQVLQAVGIDPSVQDSATIHRFKSAISQIKKRKAYARIVSQYTF